MGLILGIDEAGRGSLCGPMVVAGAIIEADDESRLKDLGVKDSKLLSASKRIEIRKGLEQFVKAIVIEVSPEEIDSNNMNTLEIEKFAQIIRESGVTHVFIDAMEADTEGVKRKILAKLDKQIELISENKADAKYLIVGAASIFAKTTRDQKIEELKQKYGDMGSGYPSDPKTKKFVKEWMEKNRFIPNFMRKKWSTVSKFKSQKEQTKLGEF